MADIELLDASAGHAAILTISTPEIGDITGLSPGAVAIHRIKAVLFGISFAASATIHTRVAPLAIDAGRHRYGFDRRNRAKAQAARADPSAQMRSVYRSAFRW